MKLIQKAAKLAWQNIFLAVQKFDDSFIQDGEKWLTSCVQNSERIGEAQYEEFLEKRILSDEAFSATMKRQSLKLPSHRSPSNSHDASLGDKDKKMNIIHLF